MIRSALCVVSLLTLPVAALGAAPADPADRVTLTLADFLKLYEEGKTRPDKPGKAPQSHTLSAARYDGRVVVEDGEPIAALLDVRFTVEVLRPGWARIPLLDGAVAVRSARIGGVDAPLMLDDGRYTLVTDRQGRFEVQVEVAVEVTTDQGTSGFSFPLVPSGATSVRLEVPGDDALDFTIANARLQQDRLERGVRVVEGTLPPAGSLAVRWQRATGPTESDPGRVVQPRVYAEVQTLATVGEGLLSATATLQHTILFAGVDRLQARVPSQMTVLDVRGAGLRDWSVDDDGLLTATLNYQAKGTYALAVDLERMLPGDQQAVEVPLLRPVGAEREKGWVGVRARGALEIRADGVEGAAAVDVRTLPAAILGVSETPVLLGFKYLGAQAVVPLRVAEHEQVDVLVTLVDQARATTMWTPDGRRLTSVQYQVRNNRRQFLRLALPDGAELWSADVAGKAVQPARSGDRVLIPLVRSESGGGGLAAFDVRVVYVETGAPTGSNGRGRFEASLPVADAPTTYVGWTVYSPDDARIRSRTVDGSLREVERLSSPVRADVALRVEAAQPAMVQSAERQVADGALGRGAAPVEVSLPLDGRPTFYEKLLALDERLWVGFDYKGLK